MKTGSESKAAGQASNMPWQIRVCLDRGFEFQTQGEGMPTLYSVDFFAHIHGVRDVSTIRSWVKKRGIRHKKFVSTLLTEEDFSNAFEWVESPERETV